MGKMLMCKCPRCGKMVKFYKVHSRHRCRWCGKWFWIKDVNKILKFKTTMFLKAFTSMGLGVTPSIRIQRQAFYNDDPEEIDYANELRRHDYRGGRPFETVAMILSGESGIIPLLPPKNEEEVEKLKRMGRKKFYGKKIPIDINAKSALSKKQKDWDWYISYYLIPIFGKGVWKVVNVVPGFGAPQGTDCVLFEGVFN